MHPSMTNDPLSPGCRVHTNMETGEQRITFPDGHEQHTTNREATQDVSDRNTSPETRDAPDDGLSLYFQNHLSPEVWRPTLPGIVDYRCRMGTDHHRSRRRNAPALLKATWIAIAQLLAAAGSPPSMIALSIDHIAHIAGVCRKQLMGPDGIIRQLVALNLIDVEQRPYPGKTGYRNVYHIDRARLERETLDYLPAICHDLGVPEPRLRHQPPADQMRLPMDDLTPSNAGGSVTEPQDDTMWHQPRATEPQDDTTWHQGESPTAPALVPCGTRASPRWHQTGAEWHQGESPTAPGLVTNGTRASPVGHQAGATWHHCPESPEESPEGGGDVAPTPSSSAHPVIPDQEQRIASLEQRMQAMKEAHAHQFETLMQQQEATMQQYAAAMQQQESLMQRMVETLHTITTRMEPTSAPTGSPTAPATTALAADDSETWLSSPPPCPTEQPFLPSIRELYRIYEGQTVFRDHERTRLNYVKEQYDLPSGQYGWYWLAWALMESGEAEKRHGPLLKYAEGVLRRTFAKKDHSESPLPLSEQTTSGVGSTGDGDAPSSPARPASEGNLDAGAEATTAPATIPDRAGDQSLARPASTAPPDVSASNAPAPSSSAPPVAKPANDAQMNPLLTLTRDAICGRGVRLIATGFDLSELTAVQPTEAEIQATLDYVLGDPPERYQYFLCDLPNDIRSYRGRNGKVQKKVSGRPFYETPMDGQVRVAWVQRFQNAQTATEKEGMLRDLVKWTHCQAQPNRQFPSLSFLNYL